MLKNRIIKYLLFGYSVVITVLAVWKLKENNSEINKLIEYNQELDKKNKELIIKISDVFLQRDSLKNELKKCD